MVFNFFFNLFYLTCFELRAKILQETKLFFPFVSNWKGTHVQVFQGLSALIVGDVFFPLSLISKFNVYILFLRDG